MGSVKLNAAKCLTCGVIIESTHVHDFKGCRCPEPEDPAESTRIFVDGGHEYIRRGFGAKARWWELAVAEEHDWKKEKNDVSIARGGEESVPASGEAGDRSEPPID
jgi:hypothetical protein